MSICIFRSDQQRSAAMEDRSIDFAFLKEGMAKIVIRIPKIRLHLQSCPVMGNCLVGFAFLKQYDSQIVVSHPAFGISCQRRPPERLNVAVHHALAPVSIARVAATHTATPTIRARP